jgi:hypothetical protein
MRVLGPVLCGLVLVGSAASVAAAAGGPGRESCRLLRTTEIVEALQQPSAGPKPGVAPLACDWALQATDTRPLGALSVYVQRGDEARAGFALAKEFHQGSRVRLRGLGQRAFYAPALGAVYVLEDRETLFFVQGAYPTGSTYDADALQRALVGLAGKAERRLES